MFPNFASKIATIVTFWAATSLAFFNKEPLPQWNQMAALCETVSPAEMLRLQTTYGISPHAGAQTAVGVTYQFTVTSAAPVAANVISRDTIIATVTDTATGLIRGRHAGTVRIVANVFNGHCTVKDSALITVIDTATGGVIVGDSVRGRTAWNTSCQLCHMFTIALDVELFGYTDATIIRRAMAHVDTLGALDILAHVRHIGSGGPLTPSTILFQPGSTVTPGSTNLQRDSSFRALLVGAAGTSEVFPATWTLDTIKALNVKNIRIPLQLPFWGDEPGQVTDAFGDSTGLYDWLSGDQFKRPLTDQVLADPALIQKITTYRNNPNMTNAVLLATQYKQSAHKLSIPTAPCVYLEAIQGNVTARHQYSPQSCFDATRAGAVFCYEAGVSWANSHSGFNADSIMHFCDDVFWETGHMAHKAQQVGGQSWCNAGLVYVAPHPDAGDNCGHASLLTGLRAQQIASWVYIGSLTLPPVQATSHVATNDATIYFAPLAKQIDMQGWGAFYGLKMMASREENATLLQASVESCDDMNQVALSGYVPWLTNIMPLMFTIMERRLDNGWMMAASKNPCVSGANLLNSMMVQLGNRAPAVKAALQFRYNDIVARIQAL